MTPSELDNLRHVEDAILLVMREAEQPYQARDLFGILRQRGYPESLARAAVWFLVDSGRLAFTPNWRLTLEPAGPATND
ncbi:MAG: hypothetical protein U0Z70_12635 [Thermomicrobiales bacterium]